MREDLLTEYKAVLGMIDETEEKAKLLLVRLDDGEIISEEEVVDIEEDTSTYMQRLFQLELSLGV